MQISVTSTSSYAALVKLDANDETNIQTIAKELAKRVVEQPHYWRGYPEQLNVSKSDLATDIAYEVARFLREACESE